MLVHGPVGFTYSVVKHYNFNLGRHLRKMIPRSRKIVHIDWYSRSISVRKMRESSYSIIYGQWHHLLERQPIAEPDTELELSSVVG